MTSKAQIARSSFVRYGALPLGLIALVVVLRAFFFIPFRVMTTAQAPSLRLGAWALARRTQMPQRGELILYRVASSANTSSATHLMVARVIALPGDILEVRSGKLLVNGAPSLDHRHPRSNSEQYALRLPRLRPIWSLIVLPLLRSKSSSPQQEAKSRCKA